MTKLLPTLLSREYSLILEAESPLLVPFKVSSLSPLLEAGLDGVYLVVAL